MNKKYIFVLIFGICLGNLLFYENLSYRRGMRGVINNNPSVPLLSSISDSLTLEWNITWGGSSGDGCRVLTNDSQGNIFVLGNTNSYGEGGSDICLIKYDKDGNFEWNITWGKSDSDLGNDIIIDNNSDIYIVGYNYSVDEQLCLIKFDKNGDQQWNTTYGGTENDKGNGIAIDSSFNIYIVGTTRSFGAGNEDIWLLKYNNTGHLQWNTTWGYGGSDRGYDIFIDSDSSIYVVGGSRVASYYDICLINFDLEGNHLWNKTWGGNFQTYDPSFDRDSSNNIYISGVKSGDSKDLLFLKYDSSGNLLWNTTWGGNGEEWTYDVLVDRKDYIWITGSTNSFGLSSKEAFLVKFDSSGNKLWNTTWGDLEADIGRALNLDFSNNILMGGNLQNVSTGDYNIFVAKYIDKLAPIIDIEEPVENQFFGSVPPVMNFSIDEPNIDQTWFQLDNGTLKTNNFTWPGTLSQNIWDMVGNGTVSIIVYANDTNNNVGFDEVLVRKDTIAPTSSISFIPHSGTDIVNISTLFTLTANDGNGSGISVVKYKINNSNWIDYGIPFNLSAYEFGDYNISYYAIDAVGNVEAIKTSLVKLVDTEISDDFPFTIIIIITALIVGAVGVSIAIILLVRKRRK